MSTHIHVFLTGTLLSVSLSSSMQCEHLESDVDREEGAPIGRDLAQSTQKLEELGKHIFFDKISVPKRMACVSCHDPAAGWTFGNSNINLHQVAATGADPHTAGSVKPPTNAYASKTGNFRTCGAPPFQFFCGGNFWNGRAEGNASPAFPGATAHVGDEVFDNVEGLKLVYEKYLGPVTDQALNPFPNKVEQNIEIQQVCKHVASAKYAELFTIAWGGEAIDCSDQLYGSKGFKAYEISFERIAMALAAWQDSKEVNSFSSKRDLVLAKDGTLDGLTDQEKLGHDLFYGRANCAVCHTDSPGDDGTEQFQLYSDDAYHNIGTPANPEIPGYPDLNLGLEGHTGLEGNRGLQKTPTLRNVDKRPVKSFVKAYTHDGWFKSLESLVHFYNTSAIGGATAEQFGVTQCDKDVTEKQALAANCWPMPEHDNFIPKPFLLGDLGLTVEEEAAIVAYLKTFSDTQTPKAPKPYK
nr:cytochrome c peroxidase [Nannocystis sp.]